MCLILRGTTSALLNLDLEYAEEINADGWGISDTSNRRTYSFNTNGSLRDTLTERHPSQIFTVHFRMATHGNVNIENAHPFDIGHDRLLFHNGVAHNFTCGPRNCSDTANLAKFLRNKPWKVVEATLKSETTSRFMVTSGCRFRKFGKWYKVGSVLGSNSLVHSLLGGYASWNDRAFSRDDRWFGRYSSPF